MSGLAWVEDYMLGKLRRVAKRLYSEDRMTGDEMRDAAHEISAVVDNAFTEDDSPAVVVERRVVTRGFTRHYRGSTWREVGAAKAHCSYRGSIHDYETDEPQDRVGAVGDILRDLPEGSRVRLVLEIEEGLHPPAWEDPWVLLKAHGYGPRSKDEEGQRDGGGAW